MPITPYLNGEHFDPESMRLLGVAFSLICVSLQVEGSDDDVKQAIANKVIEFAKAGTRNPRRSDFGGKPENICSRVGKSVSGRGA